MDNSNVSKNRQNDYLGVNKIGKNIRKSPLHQPNFVNTGANNNNSSIGSSPARQQPQPQVYNISKNDFRSIVQQLTGSPSQQDPLPRPPNNPPKHPSMRLQRIRPPPLTPINRPPVPQVVVTQPPMQPQPPQGSLLGPPQVPFNNIFSRPPQQFGEPSPRGMQRPQFGQPPPRGMQPYGGGERTWMTPALSPISAYMQQLESCIGDGAQRPGQPQLYPQMQGQFQGQPHMQPQFPGHFQGQRPMQPHGPGQFQHQHPIHPQGPGQVQGQPPMHSQAPGPAQAPGQVQALPPSLGLLPNPNMPPLPSPGANGPGLLPSPTSQFLLPSPTFFNNILSPTPRSPYPLLSPGSQFPPPLSPNFAFSPMGQYGFLGSGPQPPLSPGIAFPLSPSGFFPISSPRWRDP